jgi:hypothetical protein
MEARVFCQDGADGFAGEFHFSGVGEDVAEAERWETGLGGANEVAGAAHAQVSFGDFEAVGCLFEDEELFLRGVLGLRIVEEAEELDSVGGAPLRLRVGINTGEALVRLDVSPGSGEGFLTGDAINTASRLQGVAPEMGVAVGVATYEATKVVFGYQELEAATVKGKTDSVRVFQPLAPRARFGTDLTRTHTSQSEPDSTAFQVTVTVTLESAARLVKSQLPPVDPST